MFKLKISICKFLWFSVMLLYEKRKMDDFKSASYNVKYQQCRSPVYVTSSKSGSQICEFLSSIFTIYIQNRRLDHRETSKRTWKRGVIEDTDSSISRQEFSMEHISYNFFLATFRAYGIQSLFLYRILTVSFVYIHSTEGHF